MGGEVREAATVFVHRRSQHIWEGQVPRGQDVAVAIYFLMRVPPRNPTAARQTTMTRTQLIEHSRGSELDREHRLLSQFLDFFSSFSFSFMSFGMNMLFFSPKNERIFLFSFFSFLVFSSFGRALRGVLNDRMATS